MRRLPSQAVAGVPLQGVGTPQPATSQVVRSVILPVAYMLLVHGDVGVQPASTYNGQVRCKSGTVPLR